MLAPSDEDVSTTETEIGGAVHNYFNLPSSSHSPLCVYPADPLACAKPGRDD